MSIYRKVIIPDDKMVFFVGDLHGSYDLYLKGCKDLGITPDDVVISVGDLVDRGDKNFQCVKEFTRKKNRYAIQGNHEDLMLKGFLQGSRQHYECWYMNGGDTTLEEVGEEGVFGLCHMTKDLPVMLEVEWQGKLLGFVHGGLDTAIKDWEQFVILAHNDVRVEESLVWDRSVIDKINRNKAAGSILYPIPVVENIDYVFHGHTPVKNPIVEGNRVYIDTGGVFNNKLTFSWFAGDTLNFYTTGDWDSL